MSINLVQAAIPIPYTELAAFCAEHHVVRLWLFGSVLRDVFTPDSDVDVLVEFDPEYVPGWEFYSAWVDELTGIFGQSVDLCTPASLSKYVKQKVMRSAQLIYERA